MRFIANCLFLPLLFLFSISIAQEIPADLKAAEEQLLAQMTDEQKADYQKVPYEDKIEGLKAFASQEEQAAEPPLEAQEPTEKSEEQIVEAEKSAEPTVEKQVEERPKDENVDLEELEEKPEEEKPIEPVVEKPVEVPAKKEEGEKEPKEKPEEEKVIGFDTVGIEEPEGNWLLKRVWWEKAQKKYEKIKNLVTKIMESRMPFFAKRNDIDRNVFDPFYSEVGLNQGQLEEVVSDLIDKAEEERKEEHGLSPKEKDFLATLVSEKKTLEQMKLDVGAIRKLDVAVDDDLSKLMEQINISRKYEQQAWQLFKEIAKVLNHKKARELYYKMDTFWKNVQKIDSYISGAFSNHFNSIVQNASDQVNRLKTAADAFKSKGVDLKKQFEKIQEEEESFEKETPEMKEKEAEAMEEKEVGWFASIWNTITWPWRKIWSLVS